MQRRSRHKAIPFYEGRTRVTDYRLRILRTVDEFPDIDTFDLHALVGGPLYTLKCNLKVLRHNGYLTLGRDQKNDENNRCKCNVYRLGKKGTAHLIHESLAIEHPAEHSNSFWHDYHTTKCMVGMALAAKKLGWEYLPLEQLLMHPSMKPISATDPFTFKVHSEHFTPDGRPFGIRTHNGHYFLAIETDMGSEDVGEVKSRKSAKQTLERKVRLMLRILGEELYRSKYGFPKLHFLFVSTSRGNLNDLKKLVLHHTNGRGCDRILFKRIPNIRDLKNTPKPFTWMLEEPWERAGFPDFLIA